MNEEESELEQIQRLKMCSKHECYICGRWEKEECELERYKCENTALKLLEKKDRQIDLMAEQLAGLAIFDVQKDEPIILGNAEEVKEYFKNKAEEDK